MPSTIKSSTQNMKYYIYPAGGHGKMLAFNMDLLGLKYEFIDDLKFPF